jgi:hypothetical protein
MNPAQQDLYDKLVIIATENGCDVVSKEYQTSRNKMKFMCPRGHIREITPKSFKINPMACKICPRAYSNKAEMNFIASIESLGGQVVGKYTKAVNKVECICKNGHICYPLPSGIQQKEGMCKKCAGNCPEEAEKNFIANIERLDGRVVGKYLYSYEKVECICKNGHNCYPRPGDVRNGHGMCRKCINLCPVEAEKKFVSNVEKMGGTVVGKYINSYHKIQCICKNGHVCYSHPGSVRKGFRSCKKCIGQCPLEAKKIFFTTIEQLGGQVVGEYKETRVKVQCICKNGHICYPRPSSVRQGGGMCKKCTGHCPIEAEKNFIMKIEKLGGEVVGRYAGCERKVKCICKYGHICHPIPKNIRIGHGMCYTCTLEQTESKGERFTTFSIRQIRFPIH